MQYIIKSLSEAMVHSIGLDQAYEESIGFDSDECFFSLSEVSCSEDEKQNNCGEEEKQNAQILKHVKNRKKNLAFNKKQENTNDDMNNLNKKDDACRELGEIMMFEATSEPHEEERKNDVIHTSENKSISKKYSNSSSLCDISSDSTSAEIHFENEFLKKDLKQKKERIEILEQETDDLKKKNLMQIEKHSKLEYQIENLQVNLKQFKDKMDIYEKEFNYPMSIVVIIMEYTYPIQREYARRLPIDLEDEEIISIRSHLRNEIRQIELAFENRIRLAKARRFILKSQITHISAEKLVQATSNIEISRIKSSDFAKILPMQNFVPIIEDLNSSAIKKKLRKKNRTIQEKHVHFQASPKQIDNLHKNLECTNTDEKLKSFEKFTTKIKISNRNKPRGILKNPNLKHAITE